MRSLTIGVSLKMYFTHRDGVDWATQVASIAAEHPAVNDGLVELFIVPSYLQLLPALEAVRGTPVLVGAQDSAEQDYGPFTGEVSPAELSEIGVRFVELGHAERRVMFGDTDTAVARKTKAALRNGLTPVICAGEAERTSTEEATEHTLLQVRSALESAPAGRVVVAYEPVWAIGADEPAPAEHISSVCGALRSLLSELSGREGSSVIYGGSARPGLWASIAPDVDGLFLGRFAHDPLMLSHILDEARAIAVSAP